MASPFNIFRRNQRVMMVVLTGLSMFAFLFFDVSMMKSGGVSKSLTVALFAGICGLGLWYVGSRRGQGGEWALWGAVLGGVAAFLFVRSAGPEPAVQGKGIYATDSELRKLAERRVKLNRFVYDAGRATKSTRPAQGFGPTDDRSMVQFLMGRKEVERLGISLSDAAVNRYLRDITEDKLSKRNFSEILRDLGIGEGDLFSYLRDELEVRLALGVQTPPYDTWLDFNLQARQSFYRPMLRATPEEQWQYFCRLNLKQSLSVVALPVNAFMDKVEDPADSELQSFFELAKGNLPGPQGEPGFLQPHRVQLAYLSADYEKFQSQAAPPTDDEITNYYEQHKDERYRIRDFPEGVDVNLPVDALQPTNMVPAFPAPEAPASEGAATDSVTPENKTEEKTEDNTPLEETKPDAESKPEQSKDGEAAVLPAAEKSPIRLVALTTQEEAAAEKAAETPAAADAAAEKTPETPTDQPEREKSDADDPFPLDLPSPGEESKTPVRYRELDDDLREEIRTVIVSDRTFAKMGEAADKAQKLMEDMAFQYQGKEEKEQTALAKQFAESLKEYAVNHGLTYTETSLMSESELATSPKEQIGAAVLAVENSEQFQTLTVVDDQFPRGGQIGPVYVPQRADSRLRTQRFAYWKIQDVPQHVPEWKDAGIKDQVQTAWKYQKARELALQRGKALLDLAKQTPGNLSAALAGQTITGEPGTAGIVIKETPRFSWMTTEMTTPFDPSMGDFMAPRLSFIDGVDQQGEDFMKTAFDELNVGETGLAANYPRTAVYVIQVRERDGAEPVPDDVEGYQSVDELRTAFVTLLGNDRMGFATRAYNLIMTNAFMRLQEEWMKTFNQRYEMEPTSPESGLGGTGRKRKPGPDRA